MWQRQRWDEKTLTRRSDPLCLLRHPTKHQKYLRISIFFHLSRGLEKFCIRHDPKSNELPYRSKELRIVSAPDILTKISEQAHLCFSNSEKPIQVTNNKQSWGAPHPDRIPNISSTNGNPTLRANRITLYTPLSSNSLRGQTTTRHSLRDQKTTHRSKNQKSPTSTNPTNQSHSPPIPQPNPKKQNPTSTSQPNPAAIPQNANPRHESNPKKLTSPAPTGTTPNP